MHIPSPLLRQLYASGSLANEPGGVRFHITNKLVDVAITRIARVQIDGGDVPLDDLTLEDDLGQRSRPADITADRPTAFRRGQTVVVHVLHAGLAAGTHAIRFECETYPFGPIAIDASDELSAPPPATPVDPAPAAVVAPGQPAPTTTPPPPPDHVPHTAGYTDNDTPDIIAERQRFVEARTGVPLRHVGHFSVDVLEARGNIENFTGVAQVPIGLAGPLRVNGEHAQGDFLIPLATTEGSLVASYNRGMKALTLAGGVTCTVLDDAMQRAPVFLFDSARDARAFRDWLSQRFAEVAVVAEATSHVATLRAIETFLAHRFAYLRFNFTTGDAAGQNMVTKATLAACEYLLRTAPGARQYFLESNLATDKKSSAVNILHGRGKRVVAEAVVPRSLLQSQLRITPEMLLHHGMVASVGAYLAGSNNTGLHSANAITALFIATGQDVANVVEGSAASVYAEPTPDGGLYMSVTIPSLIVGTFGGGTGLGTQRECLELLGCHGAGKVRKFAEIVAGVVLAGELSLAAAISAGDWVSAHESLGRNR